MFSTRQGLRETTSLLLSDTFVYFDSCAPLRCLSFLGERRMKDGQRGEHKPVQASEPVASSAIGSRPWLVTSCASVSCASCGSVSESLRAPPGCS